MVNSDQWAGIPIDNQHSHDAATAREPSMQRSIERTTSDSRATEVQVQ